MTHQPDSASFRLPHGGFPSPAYVASSRRKRLLDIAVATLALLFFAPLMLVVALCIYCESGGPVLFRQERCGLGGRVFKILKFRTMTVASGAGELRQAVRGDARVTRVGGVLRRLSVDELPQLINVLRGEMSIVGPRPHAVSHDLEWARHVPGYLGRFRAKPGLTGQAQVIGLRGLVTTPADIEARAAADNAYIEDWSISRDIWLIVRTAPTLLGHQAAF